MVRSFVRPCGVRSGGALDSFSSLWAAFMLCISSDSALSI